MKQKQLKIPYINNYKESHRYIAIENLKKAIEINDLELISYNYRTLIDLFFRGIENKHIDNSKNILNNLVTILVKRNRRLTLELVFFLENCL